MLAFIGTYQGQEIDGNCVLLSASHENFSAFGLKNDSIVRCDQVMTLDCRDCIGKLGTLPPELMAQVDEKLRFALDLK